MYRNNEYFKSRAFEEIKRAKRYPSFVSLLFFDLSHINSEEELDNFNDLDQFRRAVRELVGKSVRETDIVSNITNGKISVLLIETPREGALTLSDRLKTSIKYFLCNNTKSPLNWRVFSEEYCFPDNNKDDKPFINALKEFK